jgi:hypothetical protein
MATPPSRESPARPQPRESPARPAPGEAGLEERTLEAFSSLSKQLGSLFGGTGAQGGQPGGQVRDGTHPETEVSEAWDCGLQRVMERLSQNCDVISTMTPETVSGSLLDRCKGFELWARDLSACGVQEPEIPREELMHLCMKLNKRLKAVEARAQELSRLHKWVLNPVPPPWLSFALLQSEADEA